MELLDYYYQSLFYFLEIPKTADLCSTESSIHQYCNTAISTLNITCILAICVFILSAYKVKFFGKGIVFLPIFIVSSFYITDLSLKIISKAELFGLENYILYFASYSFLIILLFSVSILFRHFEKPTALLAIIVSVISILVMAYYGRGTFEHYNLTIGLSPTGFAFENILSSLAFQLILFLLFITIVYSLIDLAAEYIIIGHLHPKYFYLKYGSFFIFTICISLTLLSLPLGNLFNKKDVANAQEYIDDVKQQIDKYYLEYGEYPKVIADYLLEDENPRLLARHEFFTMGLRGTYYFSREDKYCFIFQNPSPEFGYYSMTSERTWRFTSATDDFDKLYINLCDETEQSYESLMAGHLMLDSPDDALGKLLLDYNAASTPSGSNRASDLLHRKILEAGEENPEVFKYYYNQEK